MKFIELSGALLCEVINDDEITSEDLQESGVEGTSMVRVNQHGDIEVRRQSSWEPVGGLLGDFEERLKAKSGLDWA
ncbi:MAG: hypothetical protein VX988_06040 [Planctomycetota bacterium]|nr:hypothetical protein [Planctomycetota bacterium]